MLFGKLKTDRLASWFTCQFFLFLSKNFLFVGSTSAKYLLGLDREKKRRTETTQKRFLRSKSYFRQNLKNLNALTKPNTHFPVIIY